MPPTFEAFPVSALFAIAKPSGPGSMSLINDMKPLLFSSHLFSKRVQPGRRRTRKDDPKIGFGGTLDPLADGVLVIGIGNATKQLQTFLDCPKEYTATCLLGSETDSYDSEGAIVREVPWKHVTREAVEGVLDMFRGDIKQTPPLYSALKMEGRPLYEYARKGLPLPRPIEERPVTVSLLEVTDWKSGSQHSFLPPRKRLSSDEVANMRRCMASVNADDPVVRASTPPLDYYSPGKLDPEDRPPTFSLRMQVSGGTYVRSLAHDIGRAVGSAAHVVTLTRTRQKGFALEPSEQEYPCIPYDVFEKALKDPGKADEDGWVEWERIMQESLKLVEK